MNVKICIHYSNYTHTLKTFRSNSKLLFEKGMVMSNAVLCLELFPEKTRFYAEAIGLFSWITGLVVMSPMAYLMREYSCSVICLFSNTSICVQYLEFSL